MNSPWRYIGFIRKQDGAGSNLPFQEIVKALRSTVYEFWDGSPHAPPKQRPQDADGGLNQPPELQVLAFQNGHPVWPEVLNDRFPEGTSERKALTEKRDEFLSKFPVTPESRTTTPGAAPRAGGLCDFTIDNGASPADVSKQVSFPAVSESDFSVERSGVDLCISRQSIWVEVHKMCSLYNPFPCRIGSCGMRNGRPALALSSNFDLWIGNTSDMQLPLEAGELFGFSTGNYEEVTVPSVLDLVPCFFCIWCSWISVCGCWRSRFPILEM